MMAEVGAIAFVASGIIAAVELDKRSMAVGEAVGGETVGGVCDGFIDFDAGDVEDDDDEPYGREPNDFRSEFGPAELSERPGDK